MPNTVERILGGVRYCTGRLARVLRKKVLHLGEVPDFPHTTQTL